jgi:type I restriction enzyme S subunit
MTPQIKQRIEQIRRGVVPEGYKKTKVGVVPNEWKDILFSDLFTSTSEYTDDLNRYPLYSLTIEDGITAKTERYERSHLVKKENAYKIVRPNDFAYNPMNVRFGAVARHKGNSEVSISGYYDIFTTKVASDLEFMDSFLISDKMITYYNKVSIGSLVEKQRVHFTQFMDFRLPLPSESERKKIAEILSKQEKLIALKEKLIEEKKRQKKALMQQLLTGKKRLPGFSDEWRKIKLSSVLIEGNKVAVVDTSMYRKMTVKLAFKGLEFTKTDREMADTRPFYVRKKNEIIIGKQNYFNGSVALVTDEFDGCICSNAIMSFGVKNVNVKFILEYISQVNFMKKREMLANGTGQKELSEKEFLNFEIKLPCVEEQNYIGNIASTCDSEILLLQKDLDQEKQKKKALMQLLLTGIVRV